jgi:hypothetical protein
VHEHRDERGHEQRHSGDPADVPEARHHAGDRRADRERPGDRHRARRCEAVPVELLPVQHDERGEQRDRDREEHDAREPERRRRGIRDERLHEHDADADEPAVHQVVLSQPFVGDLRIAPKLLLDVLVVPHRPPPFEHPPRFWQRTVRIDGFDEPAS